MRCKKAICGILLLCMSAFVFNAAFADGSVTASLTSNKQTAVEGDTITLEFFVDSVSAIESGTLIFNFPQEVVESVTVTEVDGVNYDFDTESLTLTEPKVFGKTQALMTLSVTLKSAVLDPSEQSRAVSFSIGEDSKINNVSVYNENQITTLTITPDVISSTVNLYSSLTKTIGITARIFNDTFSQNVDCGEIAGTKLSLAPIRVSSLPAGTYTLEVTGEGYMKATATVSTSGNRSVTVNGFFAGDVNGDGKIDMKDFNRLASYIYDDRTDTAGDLNRDTKVDKADIKCFTDSYLKKLRSDK